MNPKLWTLLASSVVLAACNNQPTASAPAKNDAPVAASPVAQASDAAPKSAGIVSADGKIRLDIQGNFADKMQDADFFPEGAKAEELVLLQHDDEKNLTIHATKLPKPSASAEDYLNKFKTALEAEKSIQGLQISVSKDVLNYQFHHGENPLYEHCVVKLTQESLYNVCASAADDDNANSIAADAIAKLTFVE